MFMENESFNGRYFTDEEKDLASVAKSKLLEATSVEDYNERKKEVEKDLIDSGMKPEKVIALINLWDTTGLIKKAKFKSFIREAS